MLSEPVNLPDDEEDEDKIRIREPQPERSKEGTLTLTQKEGYIRLSMRFSPCVHDTEGGQSAGAEMDLALDRARRLWPFFEPVRRAPVEGQDPGVEIWDVKFTKS